MQFKLSVTAPAREVAAQVREQIGKQASLSDPLDQNLAAAIVAYVKDVTRRVPPEAGDQPMLAELAVDIRVQYAPVQALSDPQPVAPQEPLRKAGKSPKAKAESKAEPSASE